MDVTAQTRLAGVIGHPVRHSLSPVIHNAAYAATGLDWVYVAFDVAPGCAAEALEGMRALGIAGLSVTTPHKDAVYAALRELSTSAAKMRAVNTVELREDGVLVGHNTDGDGFVDSLRAETGIDPAGLRVAVLGAGGAARSVVEALGRAGACDVAVLNRTSTRALDAAHLAGPVGRVGRNTDLHDADIIVNATSIGMGGDEIPLDPVLLRRGQIVADLVYHPIDTALLRAAAAAGARPVDGLGMLVHQAARQFRIWTGKSAPLPVMRAAAQSELMRRRSQR
jgi:shikimate dehydrogenase